ncbi:MAG: hypothetical protein SFU99_15110 [Saprospiraceae bacterium]|nr:hypothetical protein [Saprospiraceae bacterium]
MTYQISIKPKQEKAVLKIIQSLQEAGLIESVEVAENLALEGEALNDHELLSILEMRRAEMNEGKSLTQEEVKSLIKVWKSLRQR